MQPIETCRAVGITPRRDAILLRAEPNRVNHPRVVRVFEINRLPRCTQRKAHPRLVEVNESLWLDDRVRRNHKPVRRRIVGEDAVGQIHCRSAVVEQFDEIEIRRIGVGKEFVNDDGAVGIGANRLRLARRPAHEIARRPRVWILLA